MKAVMQLGPWDQVLNWGQVASALGQSGLNRNEPQSSPRDHLKMSNLRTEEALRSAPQSALPIVGVFNPKLHVRDKVNATAWCGDDARSLRRSNRMSDAGRSSQQHGHE